MPSWLRKSMFFTLIVVLAVGFPLDNQQRGQEGAFPSIAQAQNPSSSSTAVVIQNLDPAQTAKVLVEYYSTAGDLSYGPSLSIGPGGNATVDQRYDSSIPDGFRGSMVVRASTDIAALANQMSGTGEDFAADTYNALPLTEVGTTIRLSQLVKNIYDTGTGKTWNTSFAIQNTGATSTAVTITYNDISVGRTFEEKAQILPYSSLFRDQATDPVLDTAQFSGAATVVSNPHPVAAIVNLNAPGRLATYRGVKGGSITLYLPFILRNIYDAGRDTVWSTAVQVQYAGLPGGSADVTLEYMDVRWNSPVISRGRVSSSSPVLILDQRYDPNLPQEFYGSAILKATNNIVANVNQVSSKGTGTYNAFASGSNTVYLPFLIKNIFDTGTGATWSSAFVVQNISTSTATIYVEYHPYGQARFQRGPFTLGPGGLMTFDQRYDSSLGDSYYGSAVVKSIQPSQPIVAIVNQMGTGPGDKYTVYQGIPR